MYRDGDFKRYKGMRVLGIDGSKIRLPQTEEIRKKFGAISYKNHAFELLYGEKDTDILLDKLEKLFLTNPTRYRFNKPPPPRKNSSSKSLLNYFKRLRKVCF